MFAPKKKKIRTGKKRYPSFLKINLSNSNPKYIREKRKKKILKISKVDGEKEKKVNITHISFFAGSHSLIAKPIYRKSTLN